MHKQRCVNDWFLYCSGRPLPKKGAKKREVRGGDNVVLYYDYATGACQHDPRTCSSALTFNAELLPMAGHLEELEKRHQERVAAGKRKPAT